MRCNISDTSFPRKPTPAGSAKPDPARPTPMKEMPPRESLRDLMKRHGLTQSDLPEIGARSVVSTVSNDTRHLNACQIARLAPRFKMPADLFLP